MLRLNVKRASRQVRRDLQKQKSKGKERKGCFRCARLHAAISIGSVMACGLSRLVIMVVIRVMIVFMNETGVFEEGV